METVSSRNVMDRAVVSDLMPESASYVPIVVGPGPGTGSHGPKAKIVGDPTTLQLQVWSGDSQFNGTANLEIQFFGVTEDASGNISLVDDIVQIPPQNGNGGNNRTQPIQITNQNKTTVSVYVVPNSQEVEVMAIVRPISGGPTGNVGVYFFGIE